jgi:hypothetical protein
MKKSILTIGLFSLVMILTSFTTPETNTVTRTNIDTTIGLAGSASAGQNRKMDLAGSASAGQNRKMDLAGSASAGQNRKMDLAGSASAGQNRKMD